MSLAKKITKYLINTTNIKILSKKTKKKYTI